MQLLFYGWLFLFILIKSANSKVTKGEELNLAAQGTGISLNYRLPNETYPEHYDIKITTDVHLGEKAFRGEVVIDIVVVNSTRKIVLHALEISISDVNIINPATGRTEQMLHEYEPERQFLILRHKYGRVFRRGSRWKLAISYNGQLREDLNGLFFSSYIAENGEQR